MPKFALGLSTGVGVDEGRGVIAASDGQFEGEVAVRLDGATVEALGKEVGFDSPASEVGDLLVFRREPGRARILEHIVEGKEAAEEDHGRSAPAVTEGSDGEGAIEVAPIDAREAVAAFGKRVFPGKSVFDYATYESVGGVLATVVEATELVAREDAGVEADEG